MSNLLLKIYKTIFDFLHHLAKMLKWPFFSSLLGFNDLRNNRKTSFHILFQCGFILFIVSYSFGLSAVVVERLIPVVINMLKHDREAFTQGLTIEQNQLYESTGLYGQSSLRHLDILTGRILQKHSLSSEVFGEGLAAFPHQLIQITWKEHRAFVYELPSLKLLKILFYIGEGWGLCRDENVVWMSNGTSMLTQRDLKTFAILKTLPVHWAGHPVAHLNDLECDGHHLYANIWQKNWIIRIDKRTGEVTGFIDASRLLSLQEKVDLTSDDVLNGIAFRPKTGTFFLTGKRWPWIFEVRLVSHKL